MREQEGGGSLSSDTDSENINTRMQIFVFCIAGSVFITAECRMCSLCFRDSTGHPCWVLSTRVPGHGVLKQEPNSACQEHKHRTQAHCQQKLCSRNKRQLIHVEGETESKAARSCLQIRVFSFCFYLSF